MHHTMHVLVTVGVVLWNLAATAIAEECEPDGLIRLVGFDSARAGVAQVCKDGVWGGVCAGEGNPWSTRNSIVVCRQLGFPDAIGFSTIDRQPILPDSIPVHYRWAQCYGLESSLGDCGLKTGSGSMCGDSQEALVLCKESISDGSVRLVGPGDPRGGIVEVYSRRYGWSTLCTDDWDSTDASVVCKQLGYAGGRANTSRFTATALSNRRYNNFECTGSESTLLDCTNVGPFPVRCFTGDVAGIQCRVEADSESSQVIGRDISLLLWATVTLFLLILIITVVTCVCRITRKKVPVTPVDVESSNRVRRVRLNSSHWLEANTLTTTVAPPSYEETVSADCNQIQHDHSQPPRTDSSAAITEESTDSRPLEQQEHNVMLTQNVENSDLLQNQDL